MFSKTKTNKLAIMFADICGSTKLYSTLGDIKAREVISTTLDLLIEITKRYEGTVIKTIGDEIMCTFMTPEQAAKAAIDMQESLKESNEDKSTEDRVFIRVGFQYGPCIKEDDGDVHGDAVNVAARMAALANKEEIFTTAETAKQLPAFIQEDITQGMPVYIKGKGEIIPVKLEWSDEEDVTCMSADISSITASPTAQVQLRLEYRETFVLLNQEREFAVLGRSATCDIPVNESLASRQHVKIELRRDKFYLVDQSTNGTYVQQSDGTVSFVRRTEEMVLHGEGVISLGRAMNDNPQELIHFSLEA